MKFSVGVTRLLSILPPFLRSEHLLRKVTFIMVLLPIAHLSFSQTIGSSSLAIDSTKAISHFSGAVSVTNNGISLIPTFSLGKPAAIFNLSMGRKRLSFEPELRVSLEGKPWSLVLWWRYKLLNTNKFRMTIGAHPALNFITRPVVVNGGPREAIVTRRFLAGELSPSYLLSKNISVGMYYLYGRGFEPDVPKNGHFLTLNSNFSNIKLGRQFFLHVNPLFYYLKQDQKDGTYFASTITLSKSNFPLSLQTIFNKAIKSNIPSSDFIWNVTLIYSFNRSYVELKPSVL